MAVALRLVTEETETEGGDGAGGGGVGGRGGEMFSALLLSASLPGEGEGWEEGGEGLGFCGGCVEGLDASSLSSPITGVGAGKVGVESWRGGEASALPFAPSAVKKLG
jgi:hypothetical protein